MAMPYKYDITPEQRAADIMDEACLGEQWIKNGVDAALRQSIAGAIHEAVAAERAKLEELLSAAVSFSFGKRDVKHGRARVTVEQRGYGKWAVVDGRFVLANDGEWEVEPLPSNRDNAFIARTRYSFDEAVERAKEIHESVEAKPR